MQSMNSINNLYELYYVIVNNDTVIEVSQYFADMTEYTIDELVNQDIADLLRCLRVGPNFDIKNIDQEIEYFLFTKSLEVRFVNIEVKNNLGKKIYFFSEKPCSRLEEKLIFEEHIFLENTINALIVSVPDLIVLKANQKFLDILDEPFNIKENIIGRRMNEIAPGFAGSEPEALWNTVLKTQKACYKKEGRFDEFSRGVTYWDTSKIPIFENGKMKYIYETSTDVTERVLSRKKIKEQNELLKRQANLLNLSNEAIFAWELNGAIIYWNKGAERMYGYSSEEAVGCVSHNLLKTIHPVDLDNFKSLLLRDGVWQGEIEYLKKDGTKIIVETNHQIILNENEQYIVLETSRDVTERKKIVKELEQHKEMLEANLESMTDCFIAINDKWQFTYINKAGEIAFGKSRFELLSRKVTDVFKINDISIENFDRTMNEKIPANFELVSEALGNRWLDLSLYPSENGLTCYFRDITSRKMADKEIARLDRLNLVGQMAAGIGHEIRNPMTSVRGYLQLLGAKQEFMTYKPTFDLMISELDRANAIITEYLALAKTRPSMLEKRNLNDIIRKLYPLIEASAFIQNKKINYLPAELPCIDLDENEISQMILNLTRNGLESMVEDGLLTIETYVEDYNVVLKVQDEGCGIPQENMDKLGLPFFTTKGNGTGLGLATSYRIVEAHNGKIEVNSKTEGTTFLLRFPISQMEEQSIEL